MIDPIDYVSSHIASFIKKTNPEETKEEDVMFFALSLSINLFLTLMFILIIGYLTNSISETVIATSFFAVLRLLAKGYHFKSMTLCVIVTSLLVASIPHIKLIEAAVFPLAVICVIIITLKSKVSFTRKTIAVCVVASSPFIGAYVVVACFAYAITLLPLRR